MAEFRFAVLLALLAFFLGSTSVCTTAAKGDLPGTENLADPTLGIEGFNCETNLPNVQLLEAQLISQEAVMAGQRIVRDLGQISVEDNLKLLDLERSQLRIRAEISVRKFLNYYCNHPEEAPKAPMVEPQSAEKT